MKKIVLALVLAAVLWGIMFSPLTAPHVPFWGMMAASACVLAVFAFVVSPDLRRMRWRVGDCFAGIAIAVGVWCVFWVGDQVSSRLFDFARPQVDLIYGMKEGVPAGLLSVLLLFLIGPAEELFWRGYVQGTLSERWGANAAFVVTVLAYALVHVPSCNFMLVMAAGVAGVVWGGLYRLFPRRLAALAVSHALWDAAVFVWFPIL